MLRGEQMKHVKWIAVLFSLVCAAVFAATPPQLINYQGVLRDASGNPQTGNFNMVFRFYGASSGVGGLFKGMRTASGDKSPLDLTASAVLRDAIHELDPAVDKIEKPERPKHGETVDTEPAAVPAEETTIEGRAGAEPESQPRQTAALAHRIQSGGSMILLPAGPNVEPGDVLVMIANDGDALLPCAMEADPMVVGVAMSATAPDTGMAAVAAAGFAYVKADATLAPVFKGDLLMTSAIPGHAMIARDKALKRPGVIIGKALEGLDHGTGRIKMPLMQR
jgi:hypothetical protein